MLGRCGSSSSAWATSAARRPPRASCAAWSREAGLEDRDRDRQRRHRRLARRASRPTSARPPPRARRGDRRSRARARQVGRADFQRFDLLLAHGPREPARAAGAARRTTRRREKVRLLREFDPARRRRRPRRARPVLRRRPTASRRCSTWSRRPAAGCSTSCARDGVSLEAAVARRLGSAVVGARRVGGGDINDAYAVELDGRRARVREDARGRAAPASTRPRRRACAGSASRARSRVPEVLGVADEPRSWRSSGSTRAAGRDGDEALGAGSPRCTRAGAERVGGATPATAAAARHRAAGAAQRAGRRLGRRSTPSGGCGRCSRRPATAAPCRAAARARSSACATGSPSSPARRSRRRACTATCGAATCCGPAGAACSIDPAAYGGHREVDLAMLRLFGSPGRALLRRLRGAAPARPRPRRARRALPAVPAARARRAVRRRLRRLGERPPPVPLTCG